MKTTDLLNHLQLFKCCPATGNWSVRTRMCGGFGMQRVQLRRRADLTRRSCVYTARPTASHGLVEVKQSGPQSHYWLPWQWRHDTSVKVLKSAICMTTHPIYLKGWGDEGVANFYKISESFLFIYLQCMWTCDIVYKRVSNSRRFSTPCLSTLPQSGGWGWNGCEDVKGETSRALARTFVLWLHQFW